jgi:hypothetical protein
MNTGKTNEEHPMAKVFTQASVSLGTGTPMLEGLTGSHTFGTPTVTPGEGVTHLTYTLT